MDTAFDPVLAGSVVRIRSVSSNQYLCEDHGRAILAEVAPSNKASQWIIEDFQGAKRIRNMASGNYLSIEHLQPFVEVIPVEDVWMNSRWMLELLPTGNGLVIHNVWHSWQILSNVDGQVKYDATSATETAAAQWVLEFSDGTFILPDPQTPIVSMPTPAQDVGSRGASVPWVEYEAEQGDTNAEIILPDRTFGTIASESSGRSAVRLNAAGHFVEIKTVNQGEFGRCPIWSSPILRMGPA